MPGGPEQLGDRGLGRGHGAVDAGERAQGVEPEDEQPDPGVRQALAQDRVRWTCRCLRASSSSWSSSRRNPTMSPSRPTPRSKARVASATRHPSFTSPTTRSAPVRAPSKNTSLNSEVPVICRMGRTSTPGWSIGTSRYDSPCGGSDVGVGAAHHEAPVRPLGVGGPHLLAGDDPLVAVEHGLGLHVGEVGAGVGLGVALAPQLGARADGVEEAALLLVGAVGDEGGAEQALPHHVDPGRGVGPDVLLVPDHLLRDRAPRVRRTRRASRCTSSPSAPRLALPGRRGALGPRAGAPSGRGPRASANVPGEVGLQPVTRLGAEGGVLGAVVEVHGVGVRGMLPGRSVSERDVSRASDRHSTEGVAHSSARTTASQRRLVCDYAA